MQVMVALIAFLAGALTVFVIELQVLNDTLAPFSELFTDVNALIAALFGGQ